MAADTLIINEDLSIPRSELSFRYARSGGPGGQHVQRTESKVELLFDLAHSPSLSEEQRQRAMAQLHSRIDQAGVLHLSSQATRSQHENREAVVTRVQQILAAALRPRKKRRPTRPSKAARQRRLEDKRRRSETKRLRGRVRPE